MFKRLILAVLIITATTTIGFSQASKLKRAKSKMEKLDYIGAISEYNRILALNDDPTAKINIAECYRKISDSENAEYWYGQVVRIPESEPVHKLFYAQALQRNGKCDLAKEWFVKFVDEVPDDLRGQYLVKACDTEEELMTKNAGLYEIKHMDFNSSLDDFGPAYYEGGLLFASERDKGGMVSRVHSWTGSPFLNLYYVDTKVESTDDGSCGEIDYGRPSKFSNDLNGKYHDSNPILSPDKSTDPIVNFLRLLTPSSRLAKLEII